MATGPSRIGSDPTAAYIPAAWRTQNNQTGNPISTDSNNDGFTDFEDWLSTLA